MAVTLHEEHEFFIDIEKVLKTKMKTTDAGKCIFYFSSSPN